MGPVEVACFFDLVLKRVGAIIGIWGLYPFFLTYRFDLTIEAPFKRKKEAENEPVAIGVDRHVPRRRFLFLR